MTELKAVIFDYYETLAELSPETRERTFAHLARKVGVDLPPGEAYRHWRELTTADIKLRLGGKQPPLNGPTPPFRTFREVWLQRSRELLAHWGVDDPAQVGADAYIGAHSNAALYPEVPDALAALRDRYRLAVLSDADSAFIEASMRRNGLAFDVVVTSEGLQAYKPHVSLFREVCARLDVQPSEAVYVGDSAWADIEGARHAGMGAVWVNRHDASWPEELALPPATVTSLDTLPATIETSRA